MKRLSIVTDSNLDSEKLKINVADKKIYYGDSSEATVLIEGSLKYRPLHCSELNNRLSRRNWNKSETLFISNEDDPILMYRKYTNNENKPTGEIDEIDTEELDPNLSFPLCGELDSDVIERIDDMYSRIFDSSGISSNEGICFSESTKEPLDTSVCQESIDIIKGFDSYTSSMSLCDLMEYSSNPETKARADLSVRYSKINPDGLSASVYNYFTTFEAFSYDSERNLIPENMIESIKSGTTELIRIEYLGGILRLFPVSDMISECIINDCTIIYGKFG